MVKHPFEPSLQVDEAFLTLSPLQSVTTLALAPDLNSPSTKVTTKLTGEGRGASQLVSLLKAGPVLSGLQNDDRGIRESRSGTHQEPRRASKELGARLTAPGHSGLPCTERQPYDYAPFLCECVLSALTVTCLQDLQLWCEIREGRSAWLWTKHPETRESHKLRNATGASAGKSMVAPTGPRDVRTRTSRCNFDGVKFSRFAKTV